MTMERNLGDGINVTSSVPDPADAGSAEVIATPVPQIPIIVSV